MSHTIDDRIADLADALAMARVVKNSFPDAVERTIKDNCTVWSSVAAIDKATHLYAVGDADRFAVLYATAKVGERTKERIVFAERHYPIHVNTALERLRVKFPEAYADMVAFAAKG